MRTEKGAPGFLLAIDFEAGSRRSTYVDAVGIPSTYVDARNVAWAQADGAQFFADKIAQAGRERSKVSVETGMHMPLDVVAGGSALVVYCAPCVAKPEPLLNLSTLPMLAATFDETATLHWVAA